MQQATGSGSDEGNKSRSTSTSTGAQSGSNAPLVIVSERGRHSDESRRIVRAQAARASAAQSRVTRARNRGEREGTLREGRVSPGVGEESQPVESPHIDDVPTPSAAVFNTPLVIWLSDVLNAPVWSLVESAQTLSPSLLAGATNIFSTSRAAAANVGSFFRSASSPAEQRPQLPMAIPRGFTTLQQRILVSDNVMALMSRTACFDFDSPGVRDRLHQLLFGLILGYTAGTVLAVPLPGHSIQGHLRIACTCLTIFQGQRADGAVFAYQEKYERGLEAAWSEAMLLDQDALKEPKSAEASLWVVFIISVTTGTTADFFLQLLHGLFEDLQLDSWPRVRSTLLDFIFPVSFLDEPCKKFYDNVQQHRLESTVL